MLMTFQRYAKILAWRLQPAWGEERHHQTVRVEMSLPAVNLKLALAAPLKSVLSRNQTHLTKKIYRFNKTRRD